MGRLAEWASWPDGRVGRMGRRGGRAKGASRAEMAGWAETAPINSLIRRLRSPRNRQLLYLRCSFAAAGKNTPRPDIGSDRRMTAALNFRQKRTRRKVASRRSCAHFYFDWESNPALTLSKITVHPRHIER